MVQCQAEIGGHIFDLQFLVDTGAEVNVLRAGLVPDHLLSRLEKPYRLTAANQQVLSGGDKSANVILCLSGTEVDTQTP